MRQMAKSTDTLDKIPEREMNSRVEFGERKKRIEREERSRAVSQRRLSFFLSSLSFGDNLDLKLQAEFLA